MEGNLTDMAVMHRQFRPRWSLTTASRLALLAAIISAVAAAVAMAHSFLRSTGYADYVEGLVLFHQTQAAAGENIYDPAFRSAPPYSIPLYGPVFYYLGGVLQGNHSSLLPGRLISIGSLLGLCFLSWHVLRKRFQADWLVAATGSLCWLALFGPLTFGTNNRVDSLSVFFGAAAVVAATTGRRWAWLAASALLLLACFTKPTGTVAPACAIVLTLVWDRRWREAAAITAVTAVVAAVIFALGDAMSQGNFSTCMIFSNMNPVRFKLAYGLTHFVCKQVLLPLGIGLALGRLFDARMRPFVLHGLLAFSVAVLTSGKVGAHVNYFIESSWAAGLCLALAMVGWQNHRRVWLVYGLAAVLVFQVAEPAWKHVRQNRRDMARWPAVMELVSQYGAEKPILTMQIGAQVFAGQQPYVADIHIVTRLAEAGKFDEEPILHDLREHRLGAVIAADDVRPDAVGHTNWTAAMRQAVATYYQPEITCGPLTVYVPRENQEVAVRLAASERR